MRLFFIAMALWGFIIPVSAQQSYRDYVSAAEDILFVEDFSTNQYGWYEGEQENCRGYDVTNGYYEIRSMCTGSFSSAFYNLNNGFFIDQSKDFQIEAELMYVSGEDNNSITMTWGQSDNKSDRMRFGISGNAQYKIDKYYKKVWYDFKNWTKSSLINPNGYNKLTVRKVGSSYFFFINESFVHSCPFEYFFGQELAFQTNQNTTIRIDNIKIGYIQRFRALNAPPVVQITSPATESRGFVVVDEKLVTVEGVAKDNDGIFEVLVNGVEAKLGQGGQFQAEVPLAVGSNKVTVKATDTKMLSTTQTFTINRNDELAVAEKKKRVALIIGNANYTGVAHLGENPINDANDMAAALRSIDFEVILETNADLNGMNEAVRTFARKSREADVALFYFAGHGMQIDQVNYLLPIGVNIKDKHDVAFECISVEKVQKVIENTKPDRMNLIVLDACRNNPFRSWQRGGETGLAGMTPPSGTLIAFSTSPGSTAANGVGRNGLYTGELIKQLRVPQRIEDVFINTRIKVEEKSGGKQSPWELARLRGKFFLVTQEN
ncbi:caspase family protein [Algivirga pacifica]|uniref:Caspase family p20 domain-containing protein n=1 Tax=Algivirga pacifica TaxID=1162670 RepID=A0ABP9D055_9BACT